MKSIEPPPFLQADYTMLHARVIPDHVHEDVIRKELTKLLGDYTSDVQEEIDFAFGKEWGVDREWTEVAAYDTMLNIIARISNRVLVGFPLFMAMPFFIICLLTYKGRNEEYLFQSKNFARLVVVQAVFLNFTPELLKIIFAPLINMFDYKRYIASSKYIVPIIKRRLYMAHPDKKSKNDYIQWSMDHSHRKNNPSERTINIISRRLNIIQFAAIQSSTITLANLLRDLAACPQTPSYLSSIRADILSWLSLSSGKWTKKALSQMLTLDSTLRESMRLWGFVSRGLLKKVIKKEGIRLPSGEHLPFGTNFGFYQYPIHRDEDIYERAAEFRPFRFITEDATWVKSGVPLVQTLGTWLGFSHGRHACPGRFFAAQQMKLVLAYIVLNYDIQPIATWPDIFWLVGSQGPPLDLKIRIRRRAGTS